MALSDILERIAADATAEAGEVRAAAEAEAERILARAQERAAESSSRLLHDAHREAERDAETVAAAARLSARDEALAAKGEIIARALDKLELAVVALPAGEYTAFLARAIVESARGDERVLIAKADSAKLTGLERAITALASERGRSLTLTYPDEAAPVEHGVVLAGERDSVDLSIAGIIAGRREELTMRFASALFAPGEDA
ncbi:MAG: V-type ATP synthase subunit E [Coriobacteriia bacterium]